MRCRNERVEREARSSVEEPRVVRAERGRKDRPSVLILGVSALGVDLSVDLVVVEETHGEREASERRASEIVVRGSWSRCRCSTFDLRPTGATVRSDRQLVSWDALG